LANLVDQEKAQEKYGIWVNALGIWGDQDKVDDFEGFDYDTKGFIGGANVLLKENLVAGLGLGYTTTYLGVDNDLGDGDIDSLHASLYGSHFTERYYLDAIFSYGDHSYDNFRKFEAFSQQKAVTSDHEGTSWFLYGEGGYKISLKKDWLLQPFFALNYLSLEEDSFDEIGADELSLMVKKRTTDMLVSYLGASLLKEFETRFGRLVPEMRAAWNYDFGIDDRSLTASFTGYPGAPFTINFSEEEHGIILGASLTLLGKSGLSSSLRYVEELRSDYRMQSLIGELKFEF
jgi:outer membrane autotransporter protein